MKNYEWLEKRSLRSVDQLRLWPENPRLDPEENHVHLSDYASDLISDKSEKESFLNLVDSISSDGFIPADPLVVWKNDENDKYYVAEGNRRVLALKLLRNPNKSPLAIRSFIRKKSILINRETIEKIKVCIAPSFEECEWYINQRHSMSSMQRPWSRLQQQRWIQELYDKYEKDIEKIISITNMTKSQLNSTLRILKIRDLALDPIIIKQFSKEEKENITSHRIPMTILERWFLSPEVREQWGLEFDEDTIKIKSNTKSFLEAYAYWLKLVIHRDEPNIPIQINTRTISSQFDKIMELMPKVSFEESREENKAEKASDFGNDNELEDSGVSSKAEEITTQKRPLNKNPDRNNMITDFYILKTSNYKLDALFRELQIIPYRYKNSIAATLRVFLDLAITEYIASEGCKELICTECKRSSFQDVTLKQRLEYLKKNKIASSSQAYKVIQKLLNPSNEHSLDTLNNYIHGSDTHHTSKRNLNSFWDFLFPLFEYILDIKEH